MASPAKHPLFRIGTKKNMDIFSSILACKKAGTCKSSSCQMMTNTAFFFGASVTPLQYPQHKLLELEQKFQELMVLHGTVTRLFSSIF